MWFQCVALSTVLADDLGDPTSAKDKRRQRKSAPIGSEAAKPNNTMNFKYLGPQTMVRPRLRGVPKSLFVEGAIETLNYLQTLVEQDTEGWRVEVGAVGPLRQRYDLEPMMFHIGVDTTVLKLYGGGEYVLRVVDAKGRYTKTLYLPVDHSVRGEVMIDFKNPILT